MVARDDLRAVLAATTVPVELTDALVAGAPDLWLASDGPAALATDLALTHPALRDGEVRARVSTSPDRWRLSVVAADRPGLLADTAGALACEGCSIATASVASWDSLSLAVHSVTVFGEVPEGAVLDRIGARLRSPAEVSVDFVGAGRATVVRSGTASGDPIVTVTADDAPGLLWATCRWLADHDVSIQAAWISAEPASVANGSTGEPVVVKDVFVVRGDVDLVGLERHLGAAGGARRRRRVLHRSA